MKKALSILLCLVSAVTLLAVVSLASAVEFEDGADAAKEGISTFALVSLIVGGVVLLAVIVLCIVKREKLAESLRAYKRELKNVTWFSWKNVWRSTVFVIVAIVVVAAVIGLLDYAFFQGQYLLVDLLGG